MWKKVIKKWSILIVTILILSNIITAIMFILGIQQQNKDAGIVKDHNKSLNSYNTLLDLNNTYKDDLAVLDVSNKMIHFKNKESLAFYRLGYSKIAKDNYINIYKISNVKDMNKEELCYLWGYPHRGIYTNYLCRNKKVIKEISNYENLQFTTPLDQWIKTNKVCNCNNDIWKL